MHLDFLNILLNVTPVCNINSFMLLRIEVYVLQVRDVFKVSIIYEKLVNYLIYRDLEHAEICPYRLRNILPFLRLIAKKVV